MYGFGMSRYNSDSHIFFLAKLMGLTFMCIDTFDYGFDIFKKRFSCSHYLICFFFACIKLCHYRSFWTFSSTKQYLSIRKICRSIGLVFSKQFVCIFFGLIFKQCCSAITHINLKFRCCDARCRPSAGYCNPDIHAKTIEKSTFKIHTCD